MIALLSDIHGNLPALQAVLEEVDRYKTSKIIFLGDVTGYFSEPHLCIDELRARNATMLLGNHDEYIVTGSGCPRSETVSALLDYQRTVVTSSQVEFLAGLPSQMDLDCGRFVHGGWNDTVDQYLYSVGETDLPGFARLYCSGHTHVQCLMKFEQKSYCNPGSVGQPRDGDCRAAYALIDGDDVTLHRVEYDIDATVAAMRHAGFSESRLWEGLYSGAQIGGRIDKVTQD